MSNGVRVRFSLSASTPSVLSTGRLGAKFPSQASIFTTKGWPLRFPGTPNGLAEPAWAALTVNYSLIDISRIASSRLPATVAPWAFARELKMYLCSNFGTPVRL